MSEVHHFSYGLWTPVFAYLMSCVGSLLGLLCTSRARGSAGRSRASWLGLAAVSIGGTGIWVMHFIAMLGFKVTGMEIRYDVGLTLLSALIAVLVVGAGLFVVGFGGPRPSALVAGGVFTGLGVASMHYLGMGAMRMAGHVGYSAAIVALSVVIAVVAATVALWFTIRVRGTWATAGATLVMGAAVTGMHYTGMAAMRVHFDPLLGDPSGARAYDFLLPLIIGISVIAVALLVTIGLSPTEDEMLREREMLGRILSRRTGTVTPPPPARSPLSRGPGAPPPPEQEQRAGRWFGGSD